MITVVLRGLLSRKLRAVLTAIAILLGVAMITGTYILTDTINDSFQHIFQQADKGIDAVISPTQSGGRDFGARRTLPASLVRTVLNTPGVADAQGEIAGVITLFHPDGTHLGSSTGAPTLLVSLPRPRFRTSTLSSGNWPIGNQLTVDLSAARRDHLHIGQRVGVVGAGRLTFFTVSGFTRFGNVSSLGGATLVDMPLVQAQRVTREVGRLDRISVAATPGVAPSDLVSRLQAAIPASLRRVVKVRTGAQDAQQAARSIANGLNFLTIALLAFGFIAVFVGAFIIFNTFSITVAQRTREFALLRTIGATRRQVLQSVLGEAFLVGLLASVLGILGGVGIAHALESVFKAFGADLPSTGVVLQTRTIIVGLLVGVVVTMVASLWPAVRATRVPPIAALQESAAPPRTRFTGWSSIAAVLFVLLGIILLLTGTFANISDTGQRLSLLGFAAVVLFIGIAMVSPQLIRPLASVVGWPLQRFTNVTGRLARDNAMRNPSRTAVTAAALMIGLALVGFVSIFGAELRKTADDLVRREVAGDLLVSNSNGFMPQGVADVVAHVPGVAHSSAAKLDSVYMKGITGQGITGRPRARVSVSGIQPGIQNVYHFQWTRGSDAVVSSFGPHDAIVSDSFASAHHLSVGSILTAFTPAGSPMTFTVRGIYKSTSTFPNWCMSYNDLGSIWGQNRDEYVVVTAVPGTSISTLKARLTHALRTTYPVATVNSEQDLVKQQDQGINQLLALIYILLAMSVIVSLFGIINTLVLSIYERTREIGMLRAIGTTRWQVRWMVTWESVITSVIGAVLGLAVGIVLAAIVTAGLASQGIEFALPVMQLVIWLVFAIFFGVLAGIWPARRAARLSVLQAVSYE